MQKLLILEEQLYNAKSHHFSYYKSILSAAKNAGLDPVLYVNKGAEESVYRQLGATPAMLTMAGLAASGTEHVHNRFLRFFMLVKNLIGNLFICRGALTSLQKTDAVLCLSTWAPHVLLFLLFKILLGNKMPKTGLLFVWYPKLGAKPSKSFLLVRSLVRLLARIHRETFIFAETKYAKQAWHEFLGLPVTYVVHPVDVAESPRTDFGGRRTDPAGIKIQDSTGQDNGGRVAPEIERTTKDTKLHEGGKAGPCLEKPSGDAFSNPFTSELARNSENTSLTRSASSPASLPATSYPPHATSASPIVFGFYGFARHEQGVDVLVKAIEVLNERSGLNAEFRIVWPKPFQMPDGSWLEPKMFTHLGSHVRFIEHALSPEQYFKALVETDWLILPYRIGSYMGRCSRISIEASALGIPVIYTQGTDLERVLYENGSGIPILEENPADLVNAIQKAIIENLEWKSKAIEKQIAAQHYFSGQSFIEDIIFFTALKKIP